MAKKMRKCFKRIVETTAEVERPVKREDVGSDEWYRIKGEVEWNPNVTAEELNHFLSLRSYYDDYLAIGSLEAILAGKKPDDKLTITKLAYRQKARAFAQEVNLHEQNVAPADLYKAGNPAWAKGLSINQLRNINAYYRTAEEEGVLDKFEQHISELLASSHDYWAGKEVFQSLVLGNE